MNKTNYSFKQNFDDAIKILISASRWRAENSVYSPFWDPDKMGPELYREEFFDEQAYVLYENDVPIASATLVDPKHSKLGTWPVRVSPSFKDKGVLYIDDLAVVEDRIGQGLISELLKAVEAYAKSHGYSILRLDTDQSLVRLVACYETYDFKIVHTKDIGHRISVYMEKVLA